MATRRKVSPEVTPLADMIKMYAFKKEELDPIKKQVDDYGKKIKERFLAEDITEFEVGDIRASISITSKEDFNEEQAIEILRNTLPSDEFSVVVKQRNYIDDDAFEKLAFNKQVDPAILNPCRTPKEPTVTLRLGKVKKKENDE